jgi:hypothetical protein
MTTNWKEEFDEKFQQMPERLKGDKWAEIFYPTIRSFTGEFKSFIETLLADQRKQIAEEIGGMRKVFNANKIIPTDIHTHGIGFNDGIDSALNVVEKWESKDSEYSEAESTLRPVYKKPPQDN